MLIIRPETPEDEAEIRRINEEAFGQKEEAEIIERLRNRGALPISLVAVQRGEIIGHIAFSTVNVESEHAVFEAISLAPMSVLPAYQRKCIGSQLVPDGLKECRNLGYEIVFLVGHPDYYPRFGFVPASSKGLKCEFEVPDEAWMVLELREEALAGRQGMVRFQPEFHESA